MLPDGGVAETRKATSNKVAYFIFGSGQKRAPSVVSENAPLFQHAGNCFVEGLWLDSEDRQRIPT
jgi:hypothetical protein